MPSTHAAALCAAVCPKSSPVLSAFGLSTWKSTERNSAHRTYSDIHSILYRSKHCKLRVPSLEGGEKGAREGRVEDRFVYQLLGNWTATVHGAPPRRAS